MSINQYTSNEKLKQQLSTLLIKIKIMENEENGDCETCKNNYLSEEDDEIHYEICYDHVCGLCTSSDDNHCFAEWVMNSEHKHKFIVIIKNRLMKKIDKMKALRNLLKNEYPYYHTKYGYLITE